MKKLLSMICVLAILSSFGTAFAASTDLEATLPSDVVVERVDVPLSVAMTDESFSAPANAKVTTNAITSTNATTSVYWNVWGVKTLNSSTRLYYPVGFSEQTNGSTVYDTYHYTRTFLGSSLDPRGDSGRVWDSGTVQADGTDCISDVWDAYIHRVYYGTES